MNLTPPQFFVGLDLGPPGEPTALAVLGRSTAKPGDQIERSRPMYALRHLQRFPTGTPFPAIVTAVVERLQTPPLPGAWLLADYTGVGQAVLRLLTDGMDGRVTCSFTPVELTGGTGASAPPCGGLAVAKVELIGTVQVLLQTRRLVVARDLPDAPLLVRELEAYRSKVTLSPNDVLSWREGRNDDLVFAVALAAWAGESGLSLAA